MKIEISTMEDRIIDFIRLEILGEGPSFELDADEDLLGSGLIGSMDIFRLIEFIEREFSIKVNPADMTIEHFATVTALTQFIQQQQAV
ncbi:MAG: acyl carrier protein [Bacteroidota bacterium]